MVATITPIRRTVRLSTPARWQKALTRAHDQGVSVRQLQCGVWVASSGTDETAAYAVTLDDCECRAAAEGDPVCKHRAALRQQLGLLDPEPPPAAPARTVTDRFLAELDRLAAADPDGACDWMVA